MNNDELLTELVILFEVLDIAVHRMLQENPNNERARGAKAVLDAIDAVFEP